MSSSHIIFSLSLSLFLFIFLYIFLYCITLAWCCCNGVVILYTPTDVCSTIPCGANAVCREHNGVGSCTCMQDYFGDPYFGCKPECLQSFDCPCNFACINAKCVDPCENACGMNSECSVVNHSPMCYCIPGYTGNAVFGCHPIPDNGKTSLALMSFLSAEFIFHWV